jgi:hypothetical protein
MRSKKLTKHQKELLKTFGEFRERQKQQRARFRKIRDDLKKAVMRGNSSMKKSVLKKFADASEELSRLKLKIEKQRINSILKQG